MKNLFLLIVVAVCVGMYFMYISPQVATVKSLMAKKAEYYDVLAKAKEIREQLDATLNQYNSIPKEDLDRLSKVIPDTFDPASFINNINVIAIKDSLTIKAFKVNDESAKTVARDVSATTSNGQVYKTNIMDVSIVGKYAAFQKFLLELESGLNLIDVAGLTVTPDLTVRGTAKSPADVYDYSLTLNSYSLR